LPKVAVIGLGRFGLALARMLGSSGVEVIAIDRSSQLVDAVKDDVAVAVRMDSTDEEALAAQDVGKVDVCVIAIGENFEAALLTTSSVKKLGVPFVICRAQSTVHAEIFRRLGADEIIQPEMQAGTELARRLANPHLEDSIQLGTGYSLVELRAPRAFQGKSLEQLNLRVKHSVNLVALKRPSNASNGLGVLERIYVPFPSEIIQPHDILVLVGSDTALNELPKE